MITQMKVYNKMRHHILYQRTRNIFERNPISLLVKGPSNPSFCPNKDTSDFIPLFKAKLDKAQKHKEKKKLWSKEVNEDSTFYLGSEFEF